MPTVDARCLFDRYPPVGGDKRREQTEVRTARSVTCIRAPKGVMPPASPTQTTGWCPSGSFYVQAVVSAAWLAADTLPHGKHLRVGINQKGTNLKVLGCGNVSRRALVPVNPSGSLTQLFLLVRHSPLQVLPKGGKEGAS